MAALKNAPKQCSFGSYEGKQCKVQCSFTLLSNNGLQEYNQRLLFLLLKAPHGRLLFKTPGGGGRPGGAQAPNFFGTPPLGGVPLRAGTNCVFPQGLYQNGPKIFRLRLAFLGPGGGSRQSLGTPSLPGVQN
jgi:hypothetical protein